MEGRATVPGRRVVLSPDFFGHEIFRRPGVVALPCAGRFFRPLRNPPQRPIISAQLAELVREEVGQ